MEHQPDVQKSGAADVVEPPGSPSAPTDIVVAAEPVKPRRGRNRRRFFADVRRSPLLTIQAVSAVVSLIVVALYSLLIYQLERSVAQQQERSATMALQTEERDALRSLFAATLPQANLRTTEGRAAYGISLEAAIALDRTGDAIGYRDMLPRFDEDNLVMSLGGTPDLLAKALKYGLKPVEAQGTANLFYVSTIFSQGRDLGRLHSAMRNLRERLNLDSKMSQWPIRIMRVRANNALIVTVGGLQSRQNAVEIGQALGSASPAIPWTLVGADRLSRQVDPPTGPPKSEEPVVAGESDRGLPSRSEAGRGRDRKSKDKGRDSSHQNGKIKS